MCIIEHWSIPQFEEQLSTSEYTLLKELRERLLNLRDGQMGCTFLTLTREELSVLIKAVPIGLEELDAIVFHTIVGAFYEYGQELYVKLKNMYNQ